MSISSFPARLKELADLAPEASALTLNDRTVTRHELELLSNQRARLYQSLGVAHGDLVTIAAAKDLDFYVSVIGLWKLGATPQPVSPKLPEREIRAIVAKVNPPVTIGFSAAMLPDHRIVASNAGCEHFSDAPLPDVVAPSFRASTSGGSTGLPKVVVSAMPTLWDTEVTLFDITANQVQLVAGPNYQGGPYTYAAFGLLCGHHLIVMERFDPEEALRLIDKYKVSWVYLVPTMLQRMLRLDPEIREKYSLRSIEVLLHTASPCPAWLKRAWIDLVGPERIFEIYGGSEGLGTTRIDGNEWLNYPGSVGRTLPGSRCAILDQNDNHLPPGELGEVCFLPDSGPGTTYRYVGSASTPRRGGWETFGDIGWLNDEGYLFLADRRTDMINTGGNNIYPAEIEGALNQHPSVRTCAVIGLPEGDLGNIVHAIIEPSAPVTQDELLEFLAERLVKYKWPRSFEFVDYPLRDDAGKTRRSGLREARIAERGLAHNDATDESRR
jgi:bile acid-coenzyme A ligase